MEKVIIGVDMGGTSIKLGIVKIDGTIENKTVFKTPSKNDAKIICDELSKNVISIIDSRKDVVVEAIGIGSPGIIDSEKGIIVYSNNISIKNISLCETLKRELNLPCFILNDANAATIAEWKFGAARNVNNLVMLTIGTGVGCGMILNNKLFLGKNGANAGGHIIVKQNGRLCTCGSKGCLETYASATALISDAEKTALKNENSMLYGQKLDAKTIFNASDAGDKVAKTVIKKFIKNLAIGIASIINLISPDLMVIGGGLSAQGDKIIVPLIKEVKKSIFSKNNSNDICIKAAELQNDAGILGAAAYAREKL